MEKADLTVFTFLSEHTRKFMQGGLGFYLFSRQKKTLGKMVHRKSNTIHIKNFAEASC